jgi:hypothetical protein
VRLGVTDFTFTELKEGELKPCLQGKNDPCDELVIGQSNAKSTQATSSPTNRPPGMGGPTPGGPGGMRRF